jgi:hypothetical protein
MSINATSWTAASDERLKTMHGTYDNALEDTKHETLLNSFGKVKMVIPVFVFLHNLWKILFQKL